MSLAFLSAILLAACALNAVGDVILLWGARHTNWEPGLSALAQTPPKMVLVGSLMGLLTIPCWFVIAPFLIRVPGWPGAMAFYAYLAFVASAFAFHLSYAFIGPALRKNPELENDFKAPLSAMLSFTFLMSVIASGALAVAGLSGAIDMSWYHYILLPALAIILVQMAFGNALKAVPFAKIAAGPVAMAAFFCSFLDVVRLNEVMFGKQF